MPSQIGGGLEGHCIQPPICLWPFPFQGTLYEVEPHFLQLSLIGPSSGLWRHIQIPILM